MAKPGGILVVGALHLDVIVNAPHLPARDETLIGSAVGYRFGGKGGNQALAAARLGGSVAMAGATGTDQFGQMIRDTLAASAVDTAQVQTIDGASGMSVAIVEDRGDYGAVVVSGVNRQIDATRIDARDARICLLQNEIPEAVNLQVAANLPRDCQLVLNAAPARRVPQPLLDRADLLIVNRVEAAQLLGQDPDALDANTAAAHLARDMATSVLLTLGAEGVACAQPGHAPRRASAYPAKVISTHGAGDCFTGALASQIALAAPLGTAVDFAQAAAALHVATPIDQRNAVTAKDVRTLQSRGRA